MAEKRNSAVRKNPSPEMGLQQRVDSKKTALHTRNLSLQQSNHQNLINIYGAPPQSTRRITTRVLE